MSVGAIFLIVAGLGLGAFAGRPAAAQDLAPQGQIYYAVLLGVEEEGVFGQGVCLKFGKKKVKSLDGDAKGKWKAIQMVDGQPLVEFNLKVKDNGDIIPIEGLGVVEPRGPSGGSFGATMVFVTPGGAQSIALSGIAVTKAECKLLEKDPPVLNEDVD